MKTIQLYNYDKISMSISKSFWDAGKDRKAVVVDCSRIATELEAAGLPTQYNIDASLQPIDFGGIIVSVYTAALGLNRNAIKAVIKSFEAEGLAEMGGLMRIHDMGFSPGGYGTNWEEHNFTFEKRVNENILKALNTCAGPA